MIERPIRTLVRAWAKALLLALALGLAPPPAGADTHQSAQINPTGLFPVLFYAPNGDLRVFYQIDNGTGNLMCRKRLAGETAFGAETSVYTASRGVGIHYAGGDELDLAAAGFNTIRVLKSLNGGDTWSFVKGYANNDSFSASYYHGLFSEGDAGLRLVFGYEHNTSIFGTVAWGHQAVRRNGVWDTTSSHVTVGFPLWTGESGNVAVIITNRGVYRSTDWGASYTEIYDGDQIPALLTASDVYEDGGGCYMVRSFSYGPSPNCYHIAWTFSNNLWADWCTPLAKVVDSSSTLMFEPRIAVTGPFILVAWLEDQIQTNRMGYQTVKYRLSRNRGTTWEDTVTLVQLSGNDMIPDWDHARLLELEAYDGVFGLVYAVYGDSTEKGVYLHELTPDLPVPGDSIALNTLLIGK